MNARAVDARPAGPGPLESLVIRAKRLIWRAPRANALIFLAQNARFLFRGEDLRARLGETHEADGVRFRVSAMVRIKNEARFVEEWMAHHHTVGVEHFYVYDNNSTDGTADRLAPYIASGLVTYVHWPTSPITPSAERDFFRRFAGQSDWVAFLDCDEFLEIRDGRSLPDVLASHSAPALGVNWRIFGSSWKHEVPENRVMQTLDRCEDRLERMIKVIAQPRQVAGLRNPHNFYYKRGRFARTADGRRVFGSFASAPREGTVELRHYVYRGDADHQRKITKGHAATAGHQMRGREAHTFDAHNGTSRPVDKEHIETIEARIDEVRSYCVDVDGMDG